WGGHRPLKTKKPDQTPALSGFDFLCNSPIVKPQQPLCVASAWATVTLAESWVKQPSMKPLVDDLRACARGKPEVGAAQGFGGSDANVFHDRHGLDHREVQWPYPIRRQVHHVARHRCRCLRQKYSTPAILRRFEQVCDLPAVLDADECRLHAFSIFYT